MLKVLLHRDISVKEGDAIMTLTKLKKIVADAGVIGAGGAGFLLDSPPEICYNQIVNQAQNVRFAPSLTMQNAL